MKSTGSINNIKAGIIGNYAIIENGNIHTSIEYWEKDEHTIVDGLIITTTITDIGIKHNKEIEDYDLSEYIKKRGE